MISYMISYSARFKMSSGKRAAAAASESPTAPQATPKTGPGSPPESFRVIPAHSITCDEGAKPWQPK